MRIAGACCGIAPGATSGGEVLERETLLALHRRGEFQHILLARGKPYPHELAERIELTWPARGQKWPIMAWLGSLWLDRCFRDHRFTHLRAHSILGPGLAALLWRGARAMPLVAHHQHFDSGEPWLGLKVKVLKRAEAVVTISEFSRRQLETLGVDPARTHVIPCGVGPEFRPREPRNECPVVLFLGELKARKNVSFLLRAWPDVLRAVPAAELWVVGDGPLREWLARSAHASVYFVGRVGDSSRAPWYRVASVFAFPSLMEGFGMPVLEAMASGLPVVCSDRGALPERFEHGRGGWHVSLEDGPGAFADRLIALLLDTDLRREMGQHNALTAKSYSWDESARRLSALLESL